MRRLSPASVLLLLGGVVILVGLPLMWSQVSFPDGTTSSRHGIDYASYDVITTAVIGVLLVAAGFAVAASGRWGRLLGVVVGVFAGLWGALVIIAAAHPLDGNTPTGVSVSVGLGAYAVAVGAGLALVGGIMGLRGRDVAVITSGVRSSV